MALSNSGENSETIASDRVSAAILAKVLEERDKERRAEAKFCIDVGTQTHGWHLNPSNVSSNNNSSSNSPQGIRVIRWQKHFKNILHTPKVF